MPSNRTTATMIIIFFIVLFSTFSPYPMISIIAQTILSDPPSYVVKNIFVVLKLLFLFSEKKSQPNQFSKTTNDPTGGCTGDIVELFLYNPTKVQNRYYLCYRGFGFYRSHEELLQTSNVFRYYFIPSSWVNRLLT
jgi:hypothetical protein